MEARYVCTPADPYDRLSLPSWVERQRIAGRIPKHGSVIVLVEHPDREADGSCRWCGDSSTDRVMIE